MKLDKLDFLKSKCKLDFEVLKKWTNTSKMDEFESLENLKKLLAYQIQKMLDTNFSKLMEILYAADISESNVKLVFGKEKMSKEIATEIAELYVLRLIKKWETRQQYKSDIVGDWDD